MGAFERSWTEEVQNFVRDFIADILSGNQLFRGRPQSAAG
jgi:hypothetical protein